jgi:hypothetical protein
MFIAGSRKADESASITPKLFSTDSFRAYDVAPFTP